VAGYPENSPGARTSSSANQRQLAVDFLRDTTCRLADTDEGVSVAIEIVAGNWQRHHMSVRNPDSRFTVELQTEHQCRRGL
jgi:hypothetical protein